MSKLVEELYETLATWCGVYMEASRLSEILAHIERLEQQLSAKEAELERVRKTLIEMRNSGTSRRHGREQLELHEGWKLHEAELLARIERLEANQIPEGYVAVPREPTIDMVEAGAAQVVKGMDYERAKKAWRAMIDAAGGTGEGQEDI